MKRRNFIQSLLAVPLFWIVPRQPTVKTVYVSSHFSLRCMEPGCQWCPGPNQHQLADGINHYLDHGYTLKDVRSLYAHNRPGWFTLAILEHVS